MTTININTEIAINRELEDAFREHIANQRAGMYEAGDLRYCDTILADLERSPEQWSETTRKELVLYLMFRAGFQCAESFCATDFEDKKVADAKK